MKATIIHGVRAVLYLTVLGLLIAHLWQTRHQVAAGLHQVGWAPALTAGVLALAGTVPAMLGWRELLAGLDTRLSLPAAARVYFVAGLTKYLPGGLWPAVAQADIARALGRPPRLFAAAFLASIAVSTVTGAAIGLPALSWLSGSGGAATLLCLLAAAVVTGVSPRVLRASFGVLRLGLTRLRTGPPPPLALPDDRAVARSVRLTALGWIITGAHVPVLAVPLGAKLPDVLLLVAAYCLATVAGMLTVILPAGLGTREVVLALAVGGVLTGSAGVIIVVLSRFLVTAADLVAAVTAVSWTAAGATDRSGGELPATG